MNKFIDSTRNLSLIDYPDLMSLVVYTQGCNLECPFCYSKHLIPKTEGNLSWADTFEIIKEQKYIEAVVFSGGEPTIHDLQGPILDCKELGLKVGLQTNGRGDYFKIILPFVDYILLSKYTPEILLWTMNNKAEDCILDVIDLDLTRRQ
jgi:pyruvate formate lyase activating enzyme